MLMLILTLTISNLEACSPPLYSSIAEDDEHDDEDSSNSLLLGQIPAAGLHPQQNPYTANQQHIQQQREVQMQH